MNRQKWNLDDTVSTVDQTVTSLDILVMKHNNVPFIGRPVHDRFSDKQKEA